MAHRARIHHLPELIRGAGVFAGGDAEPAFLAHLRQRSKILRRPDRLFQEHRLCLAAFVREGGCGRAVHRAVHVDHQRDIFADRFSRGKHRRRGRLVQLDGAIALPQRRLAFLCDEVGIADPQQARIGRNLRALLRAQQAMQRHAFGAGGEIPQRDIQRRDREHRDAVAAEQMQIALDLLHESRDSGGIGHLLAAACGAIISSIAGAAWSAGRRSRKHRPSRSGRHRDDLDHDDSSAEMAEAPCLKLATPAS